MTKRSTSESMNAVNCPKCKAPEFRVVGQIPITCFNPNTGGRWMLRHDGCGGHTPVSKKC